MDFFIFILSQNYVLYEAWMRESMDERMGLPYTFPSGSLVLVAVLWGKDLYIEMEDIEDLIC